jgi:hypothetical protein
MGLLINSELIWLSIPRCASVSIEKSLLKSNLNIRRLDFDKEYPNAHMHFKKSSLYENFGIHKTICIKRDWFDRWLSGLRHFFHVTEKSKLYTPIIQWKDVDNDFIYKTFDVEFTNVLYSTDNSEWDNIHLRLIKEKKLKDVHFINGFIVPNYNGILAALQSPNFIKENEPADYEFDISEIDKFSDFIYDKFGERLNIEKLNHSSKVSSKIVINDELRQWVWDKFEKPFEKRNQLI